MYSVLQFIMHNSFHVSDYDMRGHKISVVMAEKSAPRAPTSGHG
jgi:hypothetical protein